MRFKQMAVILQFSKNGRSLYVDSQMKNIRAETGSYGHEYQFSRYVDVQSDQIGTDNSRESPTGNITIIKSAIIPTEAERE